MCKLINFDIFGTLCLTWAFKNLNMFLGKKLHLIYTIVACCINITTAKNQSCINTIIIFK